MLDLERKTRLENVYKHLKNIGVIASQIDLSQKLGMNRSSVSLALKGDKRYATDSFMKNLCASFPNVFNLQWLLTGYGTMLVDLDESANNETEETLPLIPIEAVGGALTGTDGQWMEYECDRYVVPAFKKSDFLIRVVGDSMHPRYCRGDIVACTKVPLTDLWFQWGRTYVVDTRQGALIKYLEPGKDEGYITLASENPKYKPFQLPVTEINGVALVNGLIRVE